MEIKQKLYIQAVKWTHDETFSYNVSTIKCVSSINAIVVDIDDTEVNLSCPDFTQEQFTNGHIDQLRKIQKNIQAEAHQKLKMIDDQIENLSAIEDKT